jgi:hypothetical protein
MSVQVSIEEAINVIVAAKIDKVQARNEDLINQHNLLLAHVPTLLKFVEHSRISCSDENPCNASDTGYRCIRCQLLRIQKYNWNDRWKINITLESEEVVAIDEKKFKEEIKNLASLQSFFS